eukprot:Anaeramoba_flamelloidesc39628_g1_i1.p2 GENE.c39628_g1_i1~~c39628_g1_i1.p2  ORF type:complete len:178 (+),score=49.49 c39628_g1_i1:73-606(+)
MVKKHAAVNEKNEQLQFKANITIVDSASQIVCNGKLRITTSDIIIFREEQTQLSSKLHKTFIKLDPENALKIILFFVETRSKLYIILESQEHLENIKGVIKVIEEKIPDKILGKIVESNLKKFKKDLKAKIEVKKAKLVLTWQNKKKRRESSEFKLSNNLKCVIDKENKSMIYFLYL